MAADQHGGAGKADELHPRPFRGDFSSEGADAVSRKTWSQRRWSRHLVNVIPTRWSQLLDLYIRQCHPKKVTPTLISVIPAWPPLVLFENHSGYRRISFSCRIRKFDGVRNRPCVLVVGRTNSPSTGIAGKSLQDFNKASQNEIGLGNMKLDHRRVTLISFCDVTVLHDVDSNGFNRYSQSSD